MELNKSYWVSDGADRINLSVPLVKVDKQRRVVSGFATLDNLDSHGDIVDTQASLNAFSRFRGNIREMHQPIAAGKLVSFRQDTFYDKETKKSYTGVFVDVYVSRGAEDTWQKVLDGTLSGFSIGGSVNKSDTVNMHDDYDGVVRIIKDYDLIELSLVDNPANQLANVFSIQKSDIGFKVTGMATEVKAVNVFYCNSDEIATTSPEISKDCVVCNSAMSNIGWVEEASDSKAADLSAVVDAYLNKNISEEGGIEKMSELNNVDVSAEEAPAEVTEETVVEATEEAPVEDLVAEQAEIEPDFEKMIEGIKKFVSEEISKVADNTPDVNQILSEMMANINKSIEDVASKYDSVAKSVGEVQEAMKSISQRMDSYESATAVKKSNDLENESLVSVKKAESIWKGHFLGVQNL